MALRKKQKLCDLKQSQGAMKSNTAKKIPQMQDGSSDDDDDEMERNFALLSKKNALWKAEEEQKGEEEEEDESVDEDEEEEEEDDDEEEDDEEEEEGEEGEDEGEDGEGVEEGEDDGEDAQEEEEDVEDATVAVSGDAQDEEEEDESSSGEEPEEEPTQGTRPQGQLETEDDVKRELSNMSFEEIMQLQNRVGMKAYNKIAYGTDTGRSKKRPDQMKRLNKHKPQEISSKQRVPFLRKVVPVKKVISRDPRFDDLSGEYKPEIFTETYKFINDIQDREKLMVKKKLKKIKSEDKKAELKFLMKRMENQERERKRREQQREKELLFKRNQRELVGQGHRPFFLKKSDKKKLELAEKYKDLKRSGKLENFIAKKRKRNATKDRRRLPKKHSQPSR
ncbi:ribosomal RNA processing protein 36 homolog [Alosa pseudoharengus]|uniref:ribosomal RNA processing protein 36 homolog n=1 Tax=Alosa pseudoharengus TaxID=34774 RepID=UPI003F896C74